MLIHQMIQAQFVTVKIPLHLLYLFLGQTIGEDPGGGFIIPLSLEIISIACTKQLSRIVHPHKPPPMDPPWHIM